MTLKVRKIMVVLHEDQRNARLPNSKMLKKILPSYDQGRKINERYKNILKIFLINVIYKIKSDDTNNVNDVNNENIVNSVNNVM